MGAAPPAVRAAEEAAAREREARRSAELAEVQAVLAAFEANGGLQRSRVARIERVQHLDLYSQYCRRKARIALEAAQHPGGSVNERRLFHGADPVRCCICWAPALAEHPAAPSCVARSMAIIQLESMLCHGLS